jgi:hypothetical protein
MWLDVTRCLQSVSFSGENVGTSSLCRLHREGVLACSSTPERYSMHRFVPLSVVGTLLLLAGCDVALPDLTDVASAKYDGAGVTIEMSSDGEGPLVYNDPHLVPTVDKSQNVHWR